MGFPEKETEWRAGETDRCFEGNMRRFGVIRKIAKMKKINYKPKPKYGAQPEDKRSLRKPENETNKWMRMYKTNVVKPKPKLKAC